MKAEEAGHAMAAESAGAQRLAAPVRWAMRAAARVMTATAYYL
jgi:ubiquinone biosynthesis monooxygenase Coq7